MSRRLRYIEFDGQVYLVQRDGQWTFPSADEALPFEVKEQHATRILDADVAYCRPKLARFPEEWTFKDEVPFRPNVDPVVRQAINASLARCVVGVLVTTNDQRLLMVKSSRGFTKGMWNIPGGFIDYGEHPEQAATREVREETGIDIRLGQLLGVYKERFQSPYFMYGFMYEATPTTMELRTDPNEIEEAQWMEPARAADETRNPFAKAAMAKRFGLSAVGGSTWKSER